VFSREIAAKNLLAALIGGVSFFLLFYTLNYMRQHERSISVTLPASRADVQIHRFSLVQSRNGGQDWEVVAREAKVFEKDSKAFLEGVQVKLYGAEGVRLKFDADRGILDTSTKDLFVERTAEPISIALSDGYTVRAPSLKWSNSRREIFSDGPVTITGPRIEVHGKGLTLGADTGDLQVIGDVQARLP
jgi:LPS export ABC transporter protein LptC